VQFRGSCGPAQAELSLRAASLDSLDRWAAWLGSTLAIGSLGLVVLADLGVFRTPLAVAALLIAALVAGVLWRPPPLPLGRPSGGTLVGAAILALAALLIAAGSEDIVGPRDPAVY